MVQVSDAKLTLLLLFHFVCVFYFPPLFKCGCCRSHVLYIVYLSDKNLHFLRLHLLCIYDDDDDDCIVTTTPFLVTIFAAATHSHTPSSRALSSTWSYDFAKRI